MNINLLALILSAVLPFVGGTWLFLRSGRPFIFAVTRGLWMSLYALIPLLAFAILAGGAKQFTGLNIFPIAPIVVLLFFAWVSNFRNQTLQQEQIAEVVTYKQGASSQLKLPNGERILISCAQTGIKIFKLALGGLIPTRTIAEWPISQLDSAIEIFADETVPTQHPLDTIKNRLLTCQSINEIEKLCARR
ncbi:hypothetical protein [Thiobacillus sp.]